jgi:hypothetical protein
MNFAAESLDYDHHMSLWKDEWLLRNKKKKKLRIKSYVANKKKKEENKNIKTCKTP